MMITPPEGRLTRENVAAIAEAVGPLSAHEGPLILDLSTVSTIDSAGVALLATIKRQAVEADKQLEIVGLSEDVKKTLDLFPFETTQPELRQRRIADAIRSEEVNAADIATGLYNVRALVEAYSGQVIVRVNGRICSIDFSQSSKTRGRPRVSFLHHIERRRPARLPGTMVLLRLPLYRENGGLRYGVERSADVTILDLSGVNVRAVGPFKGEPDSEDW